MSRQVNSLAHGAMLAAVAGLLGICALLLPVVGAVANVLWSIPIIIMVLRFGPGAGVMCLLVALGVVSLTVGPFSALSLGLRGGLAALVFGYAFRKEWSPGLTVLGGGIVIVVGSALLLLLAYLVTGVPLVDMQELENTVDQTMELYHRYGLLDPLLQQGTTEAEFREQLRAMMALMVALLPGMMFLGSLVSGAITYLVSRQVLKRLGHSLKSIPPFRRWQLPWYTVWGLIAGLACYLAGDYWSVQPLALIGQNILYIYLPLLLINGLAVAVYFYHKWPLHPFLRGVTVALAAFYLPLTAPLLVILGAFDPLFNYRKLQFGRKEGE